MWQPEDSRPSRPLSPTKPTRLSFEYIHLFGVFEKLQEINDFRMYMFEEDMNKQNYIGAINL